MINKRAVKCGAVINYTHTLDVDMSKIDREKIREQILEMYRNSTSVILPYTEPEIITINPRRLYGHKHKK